MTVIYAIIILGIIVMTHETGHYTLARLSGIEVPELSFGFGPKLISYRGKTEYSLRLIPFGGFCRLEEKDGIKFRDYPAFKRFLVFIGGSLFNIIMAILLLFIIYFAIFGTPMVNDTIVGATETPGIETNDRIISVDGHTVSRWHDIPESGEFIIERDGDLEKIYIEKFVALSQTQKYNMRDSLLGTYFTLAIFYEVVTGELASGDVEVMGPIGIVTLTGEVTKTADIIQIIFMLVSLNICIGITNLLPIPLLDGGHILLLLIETIRRKPLTKKTERTIVTLGLILLVTIFMLATVQDISRILQDRIFF